MGRLDRVRRGERPGEGAGDAEPVDGDGLGEALAQGPGSVGVVLFESGGQGAELGLGGVAVGGVPGVVEGPVDPGVLGDGQVGVRGRCGACAHGNAR